LTLQEILDVEASCVRDIESNHQVYRKSVPLATAREINGVRAVFGETYPDPVTVVSIGVDVDELLRDPKNSKWIDYSVEFCGGTHLGKTGESKLFVIMSEGGKEKGVRRIEAVTGEAARKAMSNADVLKAKLEECKGKTADQVKDILAALKQELESTPIPHLTRDSFKKEIDSITSRLTSDAKEALATAQTEAKKIVEELKANPPPFYVHQIQLGAERKNVGTVQQIFKDALPNLPVMIVSTGPKETMVVCSVPKGFGKIKASEWCTSITAKLGGRGGGSVEAAQATIQGEKYQEIFDLAKQFASVSLQ